LYIGAFYRAVERYDPEAGVYDLVAQRLAVYTGRGGQAILLCRWVVEEQGNPQKFTAIQVGRFGFQ
jgi:hypothetical protein